MSRKSTRRSLALEPIKPTPRILPAMPIRVSYEPNNIRVSLSNGASGAEIHFSYVGPHPTAGAYEMDAPKLIETFLDLRTPGEAVDFFAMAGVFHNAREDESDRAPLTWNDIQAWQGVLRVLLQQGSIRDTAVQSQGSVIIKYDIREELRAVLDSASVQEQSWMDGVPHDISILSRPDKTEDGRAILEAEIIVHSVLEAMLAQHSIDRLNGVARQVCALPDCNVLYEVTSLHKREYCGQPCAHRASVRRRRAAEKEKLLALKQAASKPNGSAKRPTQT